MLDLELLIKLRYFWHQIGVQREELRIEELREVLGQVMAFLQTTLQVLRHFRDVWHEVIVAHLLKVLPRAELKFG